MEFIHTDSIIAITDATITIKRIFRSVLLQLSCASELSEDLVKVPVKILIHKTGMKPKIQPS